MLRRFRLGALNHSGCAGYGVGGVGFGAVVALRTQGPELCEPLRLGAVKTDEMVVWQEFLADCETWRAHVERGGHVVPIR